MSRAVAGLSRGRWGGPRGGARVLWGKRCGNAGSALGARQGPKMCFGWEGFTQGRAGQDGERVVQLQSPVLRPFCTALRIH